MRVGFIAESFLPSINGVTNSVLRMLEFLRTTGDEAFVIACSHPDGVPEEYAGFPVYSTASLPFPSYPELRLSTAVSHSVTKLLTELNPDVLHLAAPVLLGKRAVVAAKKLGIPTVALFQTEIPQYAARYGFGGATGILWRHFRQLHNMATINLAPSSYTRDELVKHGFDRVGVWGRGVDTVRFAPGRRDETLHAGWAPNGEVVIGYMGRLGAEKRVEDLATLADIPNTRLVIIGDGPQRTSLRRKLPQAVFTGMLLGDELPRHLASLDIFVHPGELETFGQALQEAQACGLPTIAPAKGGPLDIIQPGFNGWLYQHGDLAALHEQVADLVGDAAKRIAFGQQARQSVEKRTWPVICGQLREQYQQAIELAGYEGER